MQPKLTVGEPNDRFEQEADRVADQVVQRQPVEFSDDDDASSDEPALKAVEPSAHAGAEEPGGGSKEPRGATAREAAPTRAIAATKVRMRSIERSPA